jgi:hypothetical protein
MTLLPSQVTPDSLCRPSFSGLLGLAGVHVCVVKNSTRSALSLAVACLAQSTVTLSPSSGSTFKMLHAFTGGKDGGGLYGGLLLDKAGNLYGTTSGGEITILEQCLR